MKEAIANRYIGMYVLVLITVVTLLVSPFNSLDPVNLPKLSALIALTFIALGLLISRKDFFLESKNRVPLVIVGLFVLQSIFVLFLDNRTMVLKFYGTTSRNTGFIAYLSLSLLLIATMASANKLFLKQYIWVLLIVGVTLAVYGIFQSKGLDFYQFNSAFGSNVFGTFGNPNFQSAFMGIVGATALSLAAFSSFEIKIKASLILIAVAALYNISLSSQQGYLNLLAGFAAACTVYLFSKRQVVLGWSFLGVFSLGFISVLLGILNKGPLAEAIYKSSLQARGFYWRAATNMIVDHPFFGVGFDGFGEWYRRTRSIEATQTNAAVSSDTAHNIPLDIGSSGGLPLMLLYLAIIGLAFNSVIRVVKRKSDFNVYFAALVAAWVSYQAQSLISINQLGLGVWGWSLTGLLIGYEINTRNIVPSEKEKMAGKSKILTSKLPAGALVITLVTSGVGIAIALPPYLAASKFYKALQSGDANIIQPAAYLRPYDNNRFLFVAQILNQNKLEAQAINVLRDASNIYPDSFEIWQLWSEIASASSSDVAHAKAEMKRLDPFNPDLK
jgi:O-antigen ligase